MAFWKKKPEEKTSAEPEKTNSIPDWYRKEEPAEPVACPWCGREMVYGTLYGRGRGGGGTIGSLQWLEGGYRSWLDTLAFTERKIDLGFYEEAWYCEICQKMTMDIGRALEKAGPNYVWENGKPVVKPEE